MRGFGGVALGLAGLVFAGSAVVFAATVVDAYRVEEVPVALEPASDPGSGEGLAEPDQGQDVSQGEAPSEGGSPATYANEPLQGIIYPRVTNDEILGAVNQDIFQPDRKPPVDRYLFPSERAAPVRSSRNDRRQREPDLRIVGTAISEGLALAIVQLDDSIPFAVLLGEQVDGFMVAAVSEESVTLTANGAEFNFSVVEPQRSRSSNNQNRNTRNGRNNASAQDVAQALNERIQQMLQQGMGRGQMGRGGGGTTFEVAPLRIIRPGGGGGGILP